MRKYDDRNLTPERKEKILLKYDYVCMYCFGKAEQVDHIIPWAYLHNDSEDNLVASCWLCNIVAGSNVFESFNEKKEFIQKWRYHWIKKNPIPLWLTREINELSYPLREKIKLTCIILDSEEERQRVKEILLNEGFRIIIGRGRWKKIKEKKPIKKIKLKPVFVEKNLEKVEGGISIVQQSVSKKIITKNISGYQKKNMENFSIKKTMKIINIKLPVLKYWESIGLIKKYNNKYEWRDIEIIFKIKKKLQGKLKEYTQDIEGGLFYFPRDIKF